MSLGQLTPLSPLITLAVLSVLLVVLTAFLPSRRLIGTGASLSVALALVEIPFLPPGRIQTLFLVDSYALFFLGLILFASLFVVLLSLSSEIETALDPPLLFPLILISTLGAGVIVTSSHFVSFFLGLETLSVSLFALIAFKKTSTSLEAGVKYLVLASTASSFLLFGIALIYAQTGSLDLATLASLRAASVSRYSSLYLIAGSSMVFIGLAFKVALVPFHMWVPDIYEGASAPIAGFIATVSKGAIFAFLLRYLAVATFHDYGPLPLVIAIIAILSMFAGNLLALLQNNVKRILAYSSIAHAGYVLVAIEASGALALRAVAYYLAVYFAAILGAFGVVTMLSNGETEATESTDSNDLSVYEGLAWRRPFIAGVLTLMLFSLAGIPLTAGFVGEFYLMSAGIHSRLWALVLSLAVSSVIGLFYYLRVILALYRPDVESKIAVPVISPLGSLILFVLALFVLALGIFPSPFMNLIASSVTIPEIYPTRARVTPQSPLFSPEEPVRRGSTTLRETLESESSDERAKRASHDASMPRSRPEPGPVSAYRTNRDGPG